LPAEIGQPAPDFSLRDQDNQTVTLEDLKGHKAVIVFIPFPFSGVCSDELCAIRDDYSSLEGLDAKVVVITPGQRFTTAAWKQQHNLPFQILSDYWPHGATAQAYGVFNEQMGVPTRASFVLDKDGVVREIIRSEAIPQPREHAAYERALAAI
jgi:peroxiredoxin (alkyl hydroperoxide reductase subunit C)